MPDGIRQIGHAQDGFGFDNEQPRHRVFIDAYEIASRPVTNAEYLEFMADGGYQRPEFWLSEGWDVRDAQSWHAPFYWEAVGAGWQAYTLNGMQPIDRAEPVSHVSYFEADAYARWAQARLPTEAEWETLAAELPVAGNFLERGRYRPAPSQAPGDGSHAVAVYGDVWEWTRSSYEPCERATATSSQPRRAGSSAGFVSPATSANPPAAPALGGVTGSASLAAISRGRHSHLAPPGVTRSCFCLRDHAVNQSLARDMAAVARGARPCCDRRRQFRSTPVAPCASWRRACVRPISILASG